MNWKLIIVTGLCILLVLGAVGCTTTDQTPTSKVVFEVNGKQIVAEAQPQNTDICSIGSDCT